MTAPRPLPNLMVAPNGARRGKSDHPALPVSAEEIAETAVACRAAGADAIHLHVRDRDGNHSIAPELYRDAMARIDEAAPGLFVQVTSESAGRYGPEEQQAMVRELRPASVSVALREMIRNPGDTAPAADFYAWARDQDIGLQHIVYSPEEMRSLIARIDDGTIPGTSHQLQIVLGSYGGGPDPSPADLDGYLAPIRERAGDLQFDWMSCAFGAAETACLVATAQAGGKMRVGFENSLWNANGTVARDNAERVAEVVSALHAA